MSASCCGTARKYAVLIILSALLWSLASIAVWRVATEKISCDEKVEVLVASKDLTTGTAFTQDNVDELTTFTVILRSAIPVGAKLILTKEELVGKRMSRDTRQGEYFNVADVGIRTPILFEEGQDIMSLPMDAKKAMDGLIGPGSSIDLVASYIDGTDREVFTLFTDKKVLAIDAESGLTPWRSDPEMRMVSFPVDQKQALLIPLAYQANCNFEIVVRRPDSPKREIDYDKTLARLEELREKRESRIAPAPRAKGEQ